MTAMRSSAISVVRAKEQHIEAVGAMLGRAFYDDPLYRYLMPNAAARKEKAHFVFECITRCGIKYGEVHATPGMEGAAIGIPSENADLTPGQMIASGMISLSFRMGFGFSLKTFSALDYTFTLHKKYAPFRHFYLFILGVDPVARGEKHASALMHPMLARLDRESLPCYLETCNETNVPMYEHWGFKVLERTTIPKTNVPVIPMIRD